MRRRRFVAGWVSTLVLGSNVVLSLGSAQEEVQAPAVLEREFARLAAAEDGKVGVAAIHLESGRAAMLNSAESFPMASTYKVPIALRLLDRVDRNEISLDQMIELQPGDIHPGSGTISRLLDDPGVALSLRNLLELMLLISDNSATDLVLRAAGGSAKVNVRLAELKVNGVRVNRPTEQLIADWLGISDDTPEEQRTPEHFRKLYRELTDEQKEAAASRFDQDPRDTATPAGMGDLLVKVWKGQALSLESTELLIDIMRRCETGNGRIKGMLPPGTEVAHKTGTIGGTTNDVGVITLPDGAGHVVMTVFVKESTRDVSEREAVIAQISRAAHDFFLFNRD